MFKETGLSVNFATKKRPPFNGQFFKEAKKAILGGKYELSLVFASSQLSRKLNLQYRQKDKPTNILSFPLSKQNGEIFINYNLAKKESRLHNLSPENFLHSLFIHGLLHLKGFAHGSKMERTEKKFAKKFGVS